jgi:hypothetical protein
MPLDHWLPGFNFNVEEWDAKGETYETLAICRSLALARAFATAVEEKPSGGAALTLVFSAMLSRTA